MGMALEFRRIQSKKFDFSLMYESAQENQGTEVPVRIYLKQNNGSEEYVGYSDIVMVQYQLDASFRSRSVASKDSSNMFEVRIWAHGSFEITVNVLLKAGRTESIRGYIDLTKSMGEIRIAK